MKVNYIDKFSVFNTYYIPEIKKEQLNLFRLTGSYENEILFTVPSKITKDYHIHFSFSPLAPSGYYKWKLNIQNLPDKSTEIDDMNEFGQIIILNEEKKFYYFI